MTPSEVAELLERLGAEKVTSRMGRCASPSVLDYANPDGPAAAATIRAQAAEIERLREVIISTVNNAWPMLDHKSYVINEDSIISARQVLAGKETK